MNRRFALHVAVSDACNNRCVFCLNRRVGGRLEGLPVRNPTLEGIRATIDEGRAAGLTELAITIAEPTLGRHLVEAVRYARSQGFSPIGMNTNGRRLGRGRLLQDLLEAGLDRMMVSIHGDVAEVHDALVGRPGAFDEVVAGLDRLAALRPPGFRLTFLHVLARANLPRLASMYRFFEAKARPDLGDGLSCTALKMMGLGVDRFEALGVPYPELVDAWLAAWRSLGAPRAMMLSEVPACVVVSRGGEGLPLPPIDVPDGRYVREDHDGQVRNTLGRDRNYAKRDACGACVVEPVCSGVMARYVERYGWDAFPPVARLPAPVAVPAPPPAAPAQDRALEAACRLLGTTAQGLAAGGLEVAGLRRQDDGLRLELARAGEGTVRLGLGPRDDARPAYARTHHLNLSVDADRPTPLADRLVARLVRRLADATWDDVLEAWAGRPPGERSP